MKTIIILSAVAVLSLFKEAEPHVIKIWLIGDSTMSIKDSKAYPETGWGMPFVYFWNSTILIENRALNGRSSKSFIAENKWQPIVDQLQEGDYVFIQFGHNDESVAKGERYSTPEQFKTNLTKYVLETRSKKAIPILLTSVSRRKFDKSGIILDTHGEYPSLTKQVARELNVLFIDIHEKSKILLQEIGPENSKLLFNHLIPHEHPNYPSGLKDDTHFNELGARKIAQIVLSEIRLLDTNLIAHIQKSNK